jgi:hypothetical protein
VRALRPGPQWLAWTLWVLAMLALAAAWLDHLLRQGLTAVPPVVATQC